MQIQTKVFNSSDKINHVIMIAQGVLDRRALLQIIAEIAAVAIISPDSKVLIDLIDSNCTVDPNIVSALLNESNRSVWPARSKVAFVCSLKDEEYMRFSNLTTALVSTGFNIAVFQGAKAAVDWLAT
ncbi:MAG TPA: hypothetical protein VGH22_15030 [Candidatus Binatia bacterium]|jgi:hypothetical protein